MYSLHCQNTQVHWNIVSGSSMKLSVSHEFMISSTEMPPLSSHPFLNGHCSMIFNNCVISSRNPFTHSENECRLSAGLALWLGEKQMACKHSSHTTHCSASILSMCPWCALTTAFRSSGKLLFYRQILYSPIHSLFRFWVLPLQLKFPRSSIELP